MEDYRISNPAAPEHEIDVRFLDEHGSHFITSVGGHALIDSDWLATYESEDSHMVTSADRIQSFLMARHVAEMLEDHDFGIGFNAEIQTLVISGSATQDQDFMSREKGTDFDLESVPTELYRSSGYTHYSDIYRHYILNSGLADHSANWGWVYHNGWLWSWVVYSNHGSPASDPSMLFKCESAYGGRTNSYLRVNNGCLTAYSYLGVDGSHLCNDDTYVTYSNIRANFAHSWYATCSDDVLNRWAPDCY